MKQEICRNCNKPLEDNENILRDPRTGEATEHALCPGQRVLGANVIKFKGKN